MTNVPVKLGVGVTTGVAVGVTEPLGVALGVGVTDPPAVALGVGVTDPPAVADGEALGVGEALHPFNCPRISPPG